MEFLTEEEKTAKKWWLIILFATVLLSASVFFGLLGSSQKIPELPLPLRLFSLGLGSGFAYLYYALCYRRSTTFLLTISLVSFWLSYAANAIFLLRGTIPMDLLLALSSLMGIVNYIFTRKLRHLNKALKGYAKFPEEAKEAAAWIQSAESKADLQKQFSEGLQKWPQLKWVLRREKAIKTSCF